MTKQISTIKDLTPEDCTEPCFPEIKDSARYHGSYFLNLKRPAKMPAFNRRYFPGDPLNKIDWKVYARTEQLIVREERDQASGHIMICLDMSDHMVWPDTSLSKKGLAPPTKFEIAARVAMNIAFRHLKVADFVKIVLLREGGSVPNLSLNLKSASDIIQFFHNMEHESFAVEYLIEQSESFSLDRRKIDLMYLVSDCLNDEVVTYWVGKAKRIRLFHTLSSFELDTDWMTSESSYFDHEVEKKEYVGKYLQNSVDLPRLVRDWGKRLSNRVLGFGGEYNLITDETSIDEFQKAMRAQNYG